MKAGVLRMLSRPWRYWLPKQGPRPRRERHPQARKGNKFSNRLSDRSV